MKLRTTDITPAVNTPSFNPRGASYNVFFFFF